MAEFKQQEISNFINLLFLNKFLEGHDGFIAGGCFKNIFNNERINDVDIFFKNNEDFQKAKKYYRDLINENTDEWCFVYENKKVWAVYSVKDKVRLELIYSVFGSPKQIISNFDFTITKFAFYHETKEDEEGEEYIVTKLIHSEDYFEHLMTKRLVLDDKIPFPVSTFNRLFKYQKYGYGMCRESKVKLLTEIHDLQELNEDELSASLYDGLD